MATILIVDDRPANRRFLVTLLRGQGHRIVEAADGREGLAAVKAEHPDLVITDVLMPVMDGYEFVRQLGLDPATARIPVLFYTAPYGEREARAIAWSAGLPYVLTKPAKPEEVLSIVGRVLSGELASRIPPATSPIAAETDREHLELLPGKLPESAQDLRIANARLRALINVGLDLAGVRAFDHLLQRACVAAHDLFGATYVSLGLVDRTDRTVRHVATCGEAATEWIKTGDALSGILETVVKERRTLRGDHPGGDPASLGLPRLQPEVQAFLAAPIASPAGVHGWICLVGNEGRSFSDTDERLVLVLAGQVGRVCEVEEEIHDRKRAESALRQERDRAQRYLDTAEVILLALDMNGHITLINRKGCDLVGWTEHELLGRSFIEMCVPARIRKEISHTLSQLLSGDESIVECPIVSRSGQERLIEWRNTLLRDDANRVISTFSCGTDLTERNQAVEALRVAEERMRFALEAAGVGIWDLDYATGSLRWSSILEAQYGLLPGAFGGTFDAFVELVHPEDRDAVTGIMARAKLSGTDFSEQHRTIWPDGTTRWLSGAGRSHLGDRGEPVRAVGISLDVTEHHSLEDQYRQAQKMDAVGQLAGGVAHDFNNLLTVILGYGELSLAGLDPGDPRRADIQEIQKAGERAATLTRQLLAFSRKQVISTTLLDLQVVVTDMQGMLGRLIGEDVKIVVNAGREPAPVKADRGQVEQIVMNLAVNARDAMPRGGTLTIGIDTVDLDQHYAALHSSVKPGRYVALTVTDTGTGITPQVRARLFEPFFTTKEPGKGTGLGLATVHGIVTQSGGSIDLQTEVGRGTSITAYLPKVDAAETVVAAPLSMPQPSADGQTVLVVDDEQGLLDLARKLLQRQGYKVLVASNADDATRVFEQNAAIDVILADVVMPGTSGPELTSRLVGRRPALKVIFMSGHTEETIGRHGVFKSRSAFLQKPFTSETLGRKIHEVLNW